MEVVAADTPSTAALVVVTKKPKRWAVAAATATTRDCTDGSYNDGASDRDRIREGDNTIRQ